MDESACEGELPGGVVGEACWSGLRGRVRPESVCDSAVQCLSKPSQP